MSRPAVNSDSKAPSSGNQPAHIRLTRVDTTRLTPTVTHLVNEAAATTTVVAAASPCPLDKPLPISAICVQFVSLSVTKRAEITGVR